MSKSETVVFMNFADEEPLEKRFYSKKELCIKYRISKNTLAAYISRFKDEFEKIGYNKYKKKLTSKEVQLLISLLGEP